MVTQEGMRSMNQVVGDNDFAAPLRSKEIILHHKVSNWPIGRPSLLYRPIRQGSNSAACGALF
jgi:hypothetical protein